LTTAKTKTKTKTKQKTNKTKTKTTTKLAQLAQTNKNFFLNHKAHP